MLQGAHVHLLRGHPHRRPDHDVGGEPQGVVRPAQHRVPYQPMPTLSATVLCAVEDGRALRWQRGLARGALDRLEVVLLNQWEAWRAPLAAMTLSSLEVAQRATRYQRAAASLRWMSIVNVAIIPSRAISQIRIRLIVFPLLVVPQVALFNAIAVTRLGFIQIVAMRLLFWKPYVCIDW